MAPTCGYICPKCEGNDYLEDGNACDWCKNILISNEKSNIISDSEWIKSVHEGSCCADRDD